MYPVLEPWDRHGRPGILAWQTSCAYTTVDQPSLYRPYALAACGICATPTFEKLIAMETALFSGNSQLTHLRII